MPIYYNDKLLTKFKNKKGGKNHVEVDGFYRDPDGNEFFIKKPKDRKELFTELFAGLLLKEFIRRELIDEIYHDSFICADFIKLDDGSYGLIQPKIVFKELFKIIGTGYRDGSDRDPLWEMFCGPQYYLLLTQLRQHFGLAVILMFSLLLGDNSVHSGNVVCLEVIAALAIDFIQFARIDWGAAFRYFGHKKNNEDLLNPFEYQGWFNPKGYTKGYFLNYKKIKGLFPAIAEQAKSFLARVDEAIFADMVGCALQQMPVDLVDHETKTELTAYLCIESFNAVILGKEGNSQQFSRDLAEILHTRLTKMTGLRDFAVASAESSLSQIMFVESTPKAVALPVNLVTPFAEQMKIWFSILSASDEKSIFDFNTVELAKLVRQFNAFTSRLLRQAETLTGALSTAHGEGSQPGHFLRCLFTMEDDLTPHFTSYTEKRSSDIQPYWQAVEMALTYSFNTIVLIKVLQNTQNSTELAKASAIHFLFGALKDALESFGIAYQGLVQELQETLLSMTGKQLVKCCLEEADFASTSLLIGLVLKNQALWMRMNLAFDEGGEEFGQDKAVREIVRLRQFHEDYRLLSTLIRELALITTFDTKGVVVNKIFWLFEKLPESLQIELAPTLTKIQLEFKEWQQRYSVDGSLDELDEECNSSSETGDTTHLTVTISSESVANPAPKQADETVASKLLFFLPAKITNFSNMVNRSAVKKEEAPPPVASSHKA
ncbi:LepB GTPase-activating domain-containing protein [Legionella sp. 29fVS95]|uniref:LepB GTPase-activating domain-containing protein n=1 Tax=Legionella sp. 29fVS95 TaxID=3402813 RepID=UPI003AF9650A